MRQALIPDRLKPGQRTADESRFMVPTYPRTQREALHQLACHKSQIRGSKFPHSFVVPALAGPDLAVRNAPSVNPRPAKAGTTNSGRVEVHGPNSSAHATGGSPPTRVP